ncbi:hypothetical protein JCM25156A_10390 [Komagataeibacter kakiaceti JCM 25156]|uniref:glycosyltransferase family 2 protein n=1 Tax=Komagataeibacter kakiaceti TaxID=943261 RepID=UPI00046E92CA|nr:glycosyltransferase family 2 protein [Komagataeibacter kakiaceti]
MKRYNCSVVVCARWEKPYILEWVTYYKSIGYDHIYLYCNDDQPDDIYREILPFVVGRDPFVTFVHFTTQGFQQQMYLHFLTNYRQETEWVSFFDVDEFLNIPAFRDIGDLVTHYPEADCILFYWIVFGHNGHERNPPGPVLENYRKRAVGVNEYTKYICRTDSLLDDKIFSPEGFGFWHNPAWHAYGEIRVVDVLHREVPDIHTLSAGEIQVIENTASVHHYMIKSKEYLRHRIRRGTTGAFSGQVIWDETEAGRKNAVEESMRAFNAAENTSLCDYWNNIVKNATKVTVPARMPGRNISLNKPCEQSSISTWSIGRDTRTDAGNAVNGVVNGLVKFHTGLEDNPWWQIDLMGLYRVEDILIYNIMAPTRQRCRNIRMEYSGDGETFRFGFEKKDDQPIGNLATGPYHVHTSFMARFIRLTLIGQNFFHLDQVEIYGERC